MSDKKITHKTIKELLARGLKEDDMTGRVAVIRGMMRIYSLQTESEKAAEETEILNSVGFSGFDGHIMTSIANNFLKYQRLSNKQYNLVAKKMQRYWRQLYKIATGKMTMTVPDIEYMMPKTHPTNWVFVK